ncbi:MAG TPA: hypothetical protein VL625_11725 [Patescibacteria group bacterium]|nr:hypothetical protein [Patescibacteria group bacterium]
MSERRFSYLKRGLAAGLAAALLCAPHPAVSKQVEPPPGSQAETQTVEELKVGDVAAVPQKSGRIKVTIITADGFVSFSPRTDWRIGGMQSRPPITQTVFQIPNSADEGTKDSTNLIVSIIRPESDKAQAVLARIGKKAGTGEVIEGARKGWKTYTQEAAQNGTPYAVIDARRDGVAGQIVWARVAWPHLKNNPPDYDKKMIREFRALLDSVAGKTGAYHPQTGELVRRPDPAGKAQ